MLELRPCCENCGTELRADSPDAMICTYECTFCRECVDVMLLGVCPNCGGNLCPRPIRPAFAWRTGLSILHQPASTRPVVKPVDVDAHAAFAHTVLESQP